MNLILLSSLVLFVVVCYSNGAPVETQAEVHKSASAIRTGSAKRHRITSRHNSTLSTKSYIDTHPRKRNYHKRHKLLRRRHRHKLVYPVQDRLQYFGGRTKAYLPLAKRNREDFEMTNGEVFEHGGVPDLRVDNKSNVGSKRNSIHENDEEEPAAASIGEDLYPGLPHKYYKNEYSNDELNPPEYNNYQKKENDYSSEELNPSEYSSNEKNSNYYSNDDYNPQQYYTKEKKENDYSNDEINPPESNNNRKKANGEFKTQKNKEKVMTLAGDILKLFKNYFSKNSNNMQGQGNTHTDLAHLDNTVKHYEQEYDKMTSKKATHGEAGRLSPAPGDFVTVSQQEAFGSRLANVSDYFNQLREKYMYDNDMETNKAISNIHRRAGNLLHKIYAMNLSKKPHQPMDESDRKLSCRHEIPGDNEEEEDCEEEEGEEDEEDGRHKYGKHKQKNKMSEMEYMKEKERKIENQYKNNLRRKQKLKSSFNKKIINPFDDPLPIDDAKAPDITMVGNPFRDVSKINMIKTNKMNMSEPPSVADDPTAEDNVMGVGSEGMVSLGRIGAGGAGTNSGIFSLQHHMKGKDTKEMIDHLRADKNNIKMTGANNYFRLSPNDPEQKHMMPNGSPQSPNQLNTVLNELQNKVLSKNILQPGQPGPPDMESSPDENNPGVLLLGKTSNMDEDPNNSMPRDFSGKFGFFYNGNTPGQSNNNQGQ